MNKIIKRALHNLAYLIAQLNISAKKLLTLVLIREKLVISALLAPFLLLIVVFSSFWTD